MGKLAFIQNPRLAKPFYTTLVRGITGAKVYRKLIVSHLGVVTDPSTVAQAADQLLSYNGMHWSMCTGRHHGVLRVSLRTAKRGQSTPDILRDIFGDKGDAGGHDTIAGGSLRVGTNAGEKKWHYAEESLVYKLIVRLGYNGKPKFTYPFI
jgi:nanoRNase/pAp phosphatase (c-di-AMP/oligoRNAs hydrolase)